MSLRTEEFARLIQALDMSELVEMEGLITAEIQFRYAEAQDEYDAERIEDEEAPF